MPLFLYDSPQKRIIRMISLNTALIVNIVYVVKFVYIQVCLLSFFYALIIIITS